MIEVDVETDLNAAVFLGLEEGYGGILNTVTNLKIASSASEEEIRKIADIALLKSPVLESIKHRPTLNINFIK
ncbi:hypothetical protein [Terrisporobacter vanillatitrophus]|uniref:hypothetical protein n=1 Tax=Terrisporobacter vanillatitrophus TaxID=3058402 RepID=UPI003EBBFE2F